MRKLKKYWFSLAIAIYLLLVAILFASITSNHYHRAFYIIFAITCVLIIMGIFSWAHYEGEIKKQVFKIALFLKKHAINLNPDRFGDSMNYLGLNYYRDPKVPCNINDEVIIHPVLGHSQALKSYPGKVIAQQMKGKDGKAEGWIWTLNVVGIKDNKGWSAWMNDYLFGRLEFVQRNYKGE